MKNIILYFTFLLTSIISPELLAQYQHVKNIDWSIAAKLPPADQQTKSIGLAGAISGTDHHMLLIAGGTNFPNEMPWNGGKKKYYNDVFIYLKTVNDILLTPSKKVSKLPFNLAYGAVCSTSCGIVVAGGENENGLSKKVLILNWKTDQLHIDFLPDLPNALTNAALTVVENVVYLAGGEIENGATDQFLSLNLKKQQEGWQKMINLPQQVSHAVLLGAENGKEVFLIGGRKRNKGDTSTIYKNVFAFNVDRQTWETKESLPYPLSAASGITSGKELLVFSGDQGETFHQAEKLIAEIDKEKDLTKKEILNQQKIKLQSNHPGFSRSVLKYDLASNTWLILKGLLPYGIVTTSAVILDHEVIIAGGEIRAGVRTPNILLGKLKLNK
jgi:N-acetylneuraminic acid mutarotase